MNPGWLDIVSTAGQSTPMLAAVLCTYLSLVAMTAVVATLHPDSDRRADARRALALLVGAQDSK